MEPVKQPGPVKLRHLLHKGHRCIALDFPYNTALIAAAKEAGAKWSATERCWHVPNGPHDLQNTHHVLKCRAWANNTGLGKGRHTTDNPPT